MPTTNPATVEKQNQDISVAGGVNELERTELFDWKKYLSTVENMVYGYTGGLVKRGGIVKFGSTTDDAGNAFTAPPRRIIPTKGGYCFLDGKFQLYSARPQSPIYLKVPSGPVSEFSVTNADVAAFERNASTALPGEILSIAVGTKYVAMAVDVERGAAKGHAVCVMDKYSNQIVRQYKSDTTAASITETVAITLVDDRYLHVFLSRAAGAVESKMLVIDLNSLPASADLSTFTQTNTAGGTTSKIVGCVAITGNSIVLSQTGTTMWLEKFNNSGVSQGSASVANWTGSSIEISTEGTPVVYVAGVNATPRLEIKKYSTALALNSTVTDTTATAVVAGDRPRVAVDSSGNMRITRFMAYRTITGTVDMTRCELFSCASGATTFTYMGQLANVGEYGNPVYVGATARFYVPVCKLRISVSGTTATREDVGAVLLVDITANLLPNGNNVTLFRPAAVLDDNYTGYSGATGNSGRYNDDASTPIVVPRPYVGSTFLYVAFTYKASALGVRHALSLLTAYDASGISSSAVTSRIGGGCMYGFDGQETHENGFVDSPSIFLADAGGGAGPGIGTYNYVVVYSFVDASGNTHYSRVSNVSSITMATGNGVSLQVTVPTITAKTGWLIGKTPRIYYRVYRTASAGTQYYLQSMGYISSATSIIPCVLTYSDLTPDSVLIANTLLFRQPGTSNTALDRYHAPPSKHMVQHKDRLFVCSGSNVYYSSFFVDGEAPWFNPSFGFTIQGGSGPVTALASMDGQLLIFKRDGIWAVDGEGPPENGGTGTEFSPPRRIMTEYGCIDQRSVVFTPMGVAYRSQRGIELLTRSGKIVWLGQNIQTSVNANGQTGGSAFDRRAGRIVFVLGATAGTYAGQIDNTSTGILAIYDINNEAWTVQKAYNGNSVYGRALQDVAYCQINLNSLNTERLIYADTASFTFYDADLDTKYIDSDGVSASFYVPMKLETGWIKSSMQDRIRLTDFFFLAQKITNHKLTISVAYDYSPTYSYSVSWEPNSISAIEQLCLNIPAQAKEAFRIKIEDAAPTDTGTYPVTTGRGPEILALTARLGIVGGGAKLPDASKG